MREPFCRRKSFGAKELDISGCSLAIKTISSFTSLHWYGKKRSKIEALRDDMDNMVTDKVELREMASRIFISLYSKEDQGNVYSYPLKCSFPKLDSLCSKSIDA